MHLLRNALSLFVFALLACIARSQSTGPERGSWEMHVGDGQLRDGVYSMTLVSVESIRDEYDKEDVEPQLTFHCTPGSDSVSARIDWHRFISSFNTDIGFKVDDDRTLWQKWGVDQSNTVTSSKSDADTAALIDYIRPGMVLAVDIAPYSGSPIVVHFDLAGFSASMDALRAACGANGS